MNGLNGSCTSSSQSWADVTKLSIRDFVDQKHGAGIVGLFRFLTWSGIVTYSHQALGSGFLMCFENADPQIARYHEK